MAKQKQQQQQHSSHSHVPKFGDWDDNNIPYTTFFENARKEQGTARTVRVNPNDPEDNPDAFMFGTRGSEIDGSDKWVPVEEHHHVRGHIRENSRGSVASKSGSDKSSSDYPGGQHRSRVPVHTRQPSATQPSNEAHNRAASIPKFGAWDEADPRSGEGFTVIFNRVKEEKQVASSTFPAVPPSHPNTTFRDNKRKKKPNSSSSMICCCLFSK